MPGTGTARTTAPKRRTNLNMRTAIVHLAADAAASAGVAAAGLVILLTGGWYRLDPLVSLAIAVLVAVQAFSLLREAFEVLLESTPPGLEPAELLATMRTVDGVDDAHDLHVWSLSSDLRALSAHVMVSGHPTLEEAQEVGVRVKTALAERYGIGHVTLELECESCGEINQRFCSDRRARRHPVPSRPQTSDSFRSFLSGDRRSPGATGAKWRPTREAPRPCTGATHGQERHGAAGSSPPSAGEAKHGR